VNFREAESYLLSLGNEVETMKLGLDNIRKLLAALGDPQNNYLKVQVAGTNGKGSVCAFLDSICREAQINAGVFTSPHLVSITERIRINGEDISEEDFARYATTVRDTAERMIANRELEYTPTFFEQITAIALLAFAEANVDLAILETGLGGRLDATTAAKAEIAAITRLDLDHQEYLGDTIEEIAAEKAAIITGETQDVIIGAQSREVMAILRARCLKFDITPLNDEYEPWRLLPAEDDTVQVVLSRLRLPPIRLGLQGRHQIENAQTAVQVAKAMWTFGAFHGYEDGTKNELQILKGLQTAKHPGRMENQERYLFDGAHNVSGAKALREYLDEYVDPPVALMFSAMKGKDVRGFADVVFPAAKKIIVTQVESSRSLTAKDIATQLSDSGFDLHLTDNVAEALETANKIAPDEGIILVTGSLYLVGEVKRLLSRQR
jgi:dihydrofolate synthase/folylpolyglutamate synthase